MAGTYAAAVKDQWKIVDVLIVCCQVLWMIGCYCYLVQCYYQSIPSNYVKGSSVSKNYVHELIIIYIEAMIDKFIHLCM